MSIAHVLPAALCVNMVRSCNTALVNMVLPYSVAPVNVLSVRTAQSTYVQEQTSTTDSKGHRLLTGNHKPSQATLLPRWQIYLIT